MSSAKPGMAVVEIDPGMSFGTGQHATTYYCLKTIDRLAGKPGVKSMLDAGCGSGILTIAAALRGYDPVDAFDNDPDAVRIAAENLALNRIGTVSPVVGDAAVWQGREERYDLVCANILGHLLVAFRNNIVNWVRPGGYLTLAGILSTEFDGVAAAFIELGFEELDRETLREWTSGHLPQTLSESVRQSQTGCRGRRINTVAVVVRVVHPVAGHIKKPLPGSQRMPEFIHRSVGQAGAAIFRDLPQLPGENRIFSGRSSGPIPDCRSSAKPARTPYPDFSPAPRR